jgi:hypothetical protein
VGGTSELGDRDRLAQSHPLRDESSDVVAVAVGDLDGAAAGTLLQLVVAV